MKKKYYSYNEFNNDVKNLSNRISDDIDTIVAISRGGLTLAHFLSESKNIRNVFSINVISYEDTEVLKEIKIFGVPNLEKSKNVLIVDDIADSGRTLKSVVNKLELEYPKVKFQTATLFYVKKSVYKPTFYMHENSDWIVFFWSE